MIYAYGINGMTNVKPTEGRYGTLAWTAPPRPATGQLLHPGKQTLQLKRLRVQ
jgi:hypothetical protein